MAKKQLVKEGSWLLLIFYLPGKKASERVGVWRKLQATGALSLRNSGYLLPDTPENQERFAWLATSIRAVEGEVSVLQVGAIDDPSPEELMQSFRNERNKDYEALLGDIEESRSKGQVSAAQLARLKRRFEEIREIDFFQSSLQGDTEKAIDLLERPQTKHFSAGKLSAMDFQSKTWMTRPRPGIDRVSSAWLIKRFIDPKARFIFGPDPAVHPKAIPFDMFQGYGFAHEGELCTFEVLCLRFGIRDKAVLRIGQAIHDADFEEPKFGRQEGIAINQVLKGWAKQGLSDEELLRRGTDLIEAMYHVT